MEYIKEVLESESLDFKVEINVRDKIPHFELGIYLPEIRLGIEIEESKSEIYRAYKTGLCVRNGIHIISIFKYEMKDSDDIEMTLRMIRDTIVDRANKMGLIPVS